MRTHLKRVHPDHWTNLVAKEQEREAKRAAAKAQRETVEEVSEDEAPF